MAANPAQSTTATMLRCGNRSLTVAALTEVVLYIRILSK